MQKGRLLVDPGCLSLFRDSVSRSQCRPRRSYDVSGNQSPLLGINTWLREWRLRARRTACGAGWVCDTVNVPTALAPLILYHHVRLSCSPIPRSKNKFRHTWTRMSQLGYLVRVSRNSELCGLVIALAHWLNPCYSFHSFLRRLKVLQAPLCVCRTHSRPFLTGPWFDRQLLGPDESHSSRHLLNLVLGPRRRDQIPYRRKRLTEFVSCGLDLSQEQVCFDVYFK